MLSPFLRVSSSVMQHFLPNGNYKCFFFKFIHHFILKKVRNFISKILIPKRTIFQQKDPHFVNKKGELSLVPRRFNSIHFIFFLSNLYKFVHFLFKILFPFFLSNLYKFVHFLFKKAFSRNEFSQLLAFIIQSQFLVGRSVLLWLLQHSEKTIVATEKRPSIFFSDRFFRWSITYPSIPHNSNPVFSRHQQQQLPLLSCRGDVVKSWKMSIDWSVSSAAAFFCCVSFRVAHTAKWLPPLPAACPKSPEPIQSFLILRLVEL
jgi:hypothetical protein